MLKVMGQLDTTVRVWARIQFREGVLAVGEDGNKVMGQVGRRNFGFFFCKFLEKSIKGNITVYHKTFQK